MESSLEVEVQLANTQEPEKVPGVSRAGLPSTLEAERALAEPSKISPAVQELIGRLMDGTEPREGENQEWRYEVQRFTPQHLNICFLRAAGYRFGEIAKIVGAVSLTVANTLKHPYGKKLVLALAPANAVKVFDIRTRMEEHAAVLLEQLAVLARYSDDVEEVKGVTFGLLDRIGHGPVQKSVGVLGTPKDFEADKPTLDRIASALDESRYIDSDIMPNWRSPRPPEDQLAPGSGGPPPPQPERVDSSSSPDSLVDEALQEPSPSDEEVA